MRRTKLYSTVALFLSSLALASSSLPSQEAHAQAGLADIQPIKPAMMLLVDTSGSMERLPDDPAAGIVDRMPSCSGASHQRNRWAITLEALTGSFENFTCAKRERADAYKGQFDEHYFLPHYEFSYASQNSDGVLDHHKHRLKFGLMTFDGVLTTVNGPTLVDFESYAGPIKSSIEGSAGMYSYPTTKANSDNTGHGWKKLFFPGCEHPYGVNAGARGAQFDVATEEPGALISVSGWSGDSWVGDGTSAVSAVNEKIQAELKLVRPYGGTPIAAMLDDFRYYLNNDKNIRKGGNTDGDPYFTCRRRFAILLTDGAPDALFRGAPFHCDSSTCGPSKNQACYCPYELESQIVSKLRTEDKLEKLWVVAFNVKDPTARAQLDAIARVGGDVDAFPVDTASQLSETLTSLMNLASPNATSRSVPVVVNANRPVVMGGKQYEISAGFVVAEGDNLPWEGRLYRRRIGCDGALVDDADLDASKGDMFHITLNAQTTRTLQTVTPAVDETRGTIQAKGPVSPPPVTQTLNAVRPVGATPFANFTASDDSANTSQAKVHASARDLVAFNKDDAQIKPGYFSKPPTTNADAIALRDKIHAYLYGTSIERAPRKLGDIYHSNPVVLPPLQVGGKELNAFDQRLRGFYQGLLNNSYKAGEGRPGVVFVGSNDGILHAFNLDTWTDKGGTKYEAGHEFWGFVPPALFDQMASMVKPTHQPMFDGTPVLNDVVFGTTSAGTQQVQEIRTVLIAAVRGAPAYVALDVTQPEKPVFLWQRSFPYLGNTLGTPAIAHVKIKWSSTTQTRAVAILPGGEGVPNGALGSSCLVDQLGRGKAPGGRDKVRCWKLRGRSLYVVDVATGELIQEFDGRHFHSPMTGSVAVDSEGLAQTSAAYMSDEDGILWRLSLRSDDPSKWRVAPIHDLFAGPARDFSAAEVVVPAPVDQGGRVARNAPLLAREPGTGKLTIVLGTGDLDDLTDTVPHRVVSLTETRVLDGEELGEGTLKQNWKLQLEPGESVTGPLVLLDDTLYFASFDGPAGGSSDLCAMGTSRIVGAHVREVDGSGLPKPKLMSQSGGGLVLQEPPADEDTRNSLLLGLSLARDPICVVGTADSNAATGGRVTQTGASGGGGLRMRSMVAGKGGEVMGGTGTATANAQKQFQRTLPAPPSARAVGWASSIE